MAPVLSGQDPGLVPTSKAKCQEPTEVDRSDSDRPPLIVAFDPAVGHPPAAIGDQPGDGAFHHRPPAPVALLEALCGRSAAGGAQLVLVAVEVDGAALFGGGAAPTQRAGGTLAREAGPAGAADRRDVARRSPEDAG